MATTRVGLMGFGRIGRNIFRLLHGRDDLDVVAISDIADPAALTYLLKYDSIYGRFPAPVEFSERKLLYSGKEVAFLQAVEPGDVPWADHGVDVVVEATTRYRTRKQIDGHLSRGAHKVVLASSPESPGEIPMVLRGINDELLDTDPDVVALGSNTSNAAAPILRTIDRAFGLKRAYMTTVKAMSNAGRLADVPTDSFRSSRAAGENIIPAETNSAEIISQVLPSLEGKLTAVALNVPVVDGSTVDLTAEVATSVDSATVNETVKKDVESDYEGIIEYVTDPIVSSDVRTTSHSGVYDSLATMVVDGSLVKTITWFNNGWGYSNRVVEVIERLATGGG